MLFNNWKMWLNLSLSANPLLTDWPPSNEPFHIRPGQYQCDPLRISLDIFTVGHEGHPKICVTSLRGEFSISLLGNALLLSRFNSAAKSSGLSLCHCCYWVNCTTTVRSILFWRTCSAAFGIRRDNGVAAVAHTWIPQLFPVALAKHPFNRSHQSTFTWWLRNWICQNILPELASTTWREDTYSKQAHT